MDLNIYGNIAKQAAKKGGACLRNAAREKIIDSTGRDVKHHADLESEKTIITLLKESTDIPILSEEKDGKENHNVNIEQNQKYPPQHP